MSANKIMASKLSFLKMLKIQQFRPAYKTNHVDRHKMTFYIVFYILNSKLITNLKKMIKIYEITKIHE